MISKSSVKKDHARYFIDVVFEGNNEASRKVVSIIEDEKSLRTHTSFGDNAFEDAKQWIRDNI